MINKYRCAAGSEKKKRWCVCILNLGEWMPGRDWSLPGKCSNILSERAGEAEQGGSTERGGRGEREEMKTNENETVTTKA